MTVLRIAGSVDSATAPTVVAAFRAVRRRGPHPHRRRLRARRLHLQRRPAGAARDREGDPPARRRPPPRRRPAGRAARPRARRLHEHPQGLRRRRGGGGELSGSGGVTDPSPGRSRVAVVIGSGSVKCAAALGLFKVLLRESIPIDMVVGCSGGALYAACIALGFDVPTAERKTRELWTKEITKQAQHPGAAVGHAPRDLRVRRALRPGRRPHRARAPARGLRRGPHGGREDPPVPDGHRLLHGRAGRVHEGKRRRRGPRLDCDPLHLPALEDRREDLRRRVPVGSRCRSESRSRKAPT